MAKEAYHKRLFDCRRYIGQGDAVEFAFGESKDADLYRGVAKCKRSFEHFVIVAGKNMDITVNRWNIVSLNGRRIEGGFFGYCPTLSERRSN